MEDIKEKVDQWDVSGTLSIPEFAHVTRSSVFANLHL